MANEKYVTLLKQDVDAWNAWRQKTPDICPNLCYANLSEANLVEANLSRANLFGASFHLANLHEANLAGANLAGAKLLRANLLRANLRRANLFRADFRMGANLLQANLSEANLFGAILSGAILYEANLHKANLSEANLVEANLARANLSRANLRKADLRWANLVEANFADADLTGCRIYGVSAWRVKLVGAKQQSLVITSGDEPDITVDNIEVAQFVYLLLHNPKIRDVIDTIGQKAVLILGRFTKKRKKVLDAIREELRKRDYVPILFDFDKPAGRDITETVSTLAHMARFVLADITDAKSIPQELSVIVPHLPSVPVQPLLLNGSGEYSMFERFSRYPWVLPICRYDSEEQLIADLGEQVIRPAEIKVLEMRGGQQVP